MKRIGIDARLYFQTGVGVYLRNLLHFLQKIDNKNIEFYIYVLDEESSKIEFTNTRFIKRAVPYRWHKLSEQTSFLISLYRDKLDLMHFTYFSHPILYNRPFIATVHDTILLEHKTGKASTLWSGIYNIKHIAFKLAFSHQIMKSRLIITPTETVKKQLLDIYGTQYESKITALYEGVDFVKQITNENIDLKKTFTHPFILYVGNFYPHKNVEKLIEAFSNIKDEIQLVLVGPADFFSKRTQVLIERLHQTRRVVLYPNATDADLIFFYKHAQMLVHPTLSEGFGLPLIEAAYFNLPVVASDIPVFREILDKEYTSFDPKDIVDIKQKIEFQLKNRARADYSTINKKFSFEKMTHLLDRIYSSELHNLAKTI